MPVTERKAGELKSLHLLLSETMAREKTKSWICVECGVKFCAQQERTFLFGFQEFSCPECGSKFTAPYTRVGRLISRILFLLVAAMILLGFTVLLPLYEQYAARAGQPIKHASLVEYLFSMWFGILLCLLLGAAAFKDWKLARKVGRPKDGRA